MVRGNEDDNNLCTQMILSIRTVKSWQTMLRSSLIRVCTVCHYICIYFLHIVVWKNHIFPIVQLAIAIVSSPEPSGSQGELIVYPYSGVRCRHRQQCLNIFSSETALPIKAKFYVEPPWEGGTKVYINGPGHMTKMAAMPIYSKNL